jgi:hypothetical protein
MAFKRSGVRLPLAPPILKTIDRFTSRPLGGFRVFGSREEIRSGGRNRSVTMETEARAERRLRQRQRGASRARGAPPKPAGRDRQGRAARTRRRPAWQLSGGRCGLEAAIETLERFEVPWSSPRLSRIAADQTAQPEPSVLVAKPFRDDTARAAISHPLVFSDIGTRRAGRPERPLRRCPLRHRGMPLGDGRPGRHRSRR